MKNWFSSLKWPIVNVFNIDVIESWPFTQKEGPIYTSSAFDSYNNIDAKSALKQIPYLGAQVKVAKKQMKLVSEIYQSWQDVALF